VRRGNRALLAAAALALALAGCGDHPMQDARDAIAAELPAPYFEDLVTESASIEGRRLVLLVRSPEGDADVTRASPRFDELRESEQAQMQELCLHPALAPLFGSDVVFVRRFVDRHDKVFFESTLPARDCAPWDLKGTS